MRFSVQGMIVSATKPAGGLDIIHYMIRQGLRCIIMSQQGPLTQNCSTATWLP